MSSSHVIVIRWNISKEMVTFSASEHFHARSNVHSSMNLQIKTHEIGSKLEIHNKFVYLVELTLSANALLHFLLHISQK